MPREDKIPSEQDFMPVEDKTVFNKDFIPVEDKINIFLVEVSTHPNHRVCTRLHKTAQDCKRLHKTALNFKHRWNNFILKPCYGRKSK